jgi:ubiquinone/menaquinone biosynthesis C-methylase UbiE
MSTAKASFPTYFPYKPDSTAYVIPKVKRVEGEERVPPRETWISAKYGKTPEEYLASGQRDVRQMRDILAASGVHLERVGNILEFGCGDGRMIRCLEPLAEGREIWGTDIEASRIVWCKQNLSPKLRFITTTTVPHLPFEDRFFDVVFAGSVFTHIDDLADTWFTELRRILRPGGTLFVTVHLRNDIDMLAGKHRDSGLANHLRGVPEYAKYAASDFDVFTIGRSSSSFVFYDMDYLRRTLEPMYEILSVTEEVRLYQNAVVLKRR